MRVLGLIVRSDLKWSTNTENMVLKGYKRLWMLRRLKKLGANYEELLDVYIKQVRSVLELAVPAWNGALTQGDVKDIERVQKTALHIMLGGNYNEYRSALDTVGLESLAARREKLSLKFAKKSVKHPKHTKWFIPNKATVNTRQEKDKFCPVYAKHKRFLTSAISYLTKLLNDDSK